MWRPSPNSWKMGGRCPRSHLWSVWSPPSLGRGFHPPQDGSKPLLGRDGPCSAPQQGGDRVCVAILVLPPPSAGDQDPWEQHRHRGAESVRHG